MLDMEAAIPSALPEPMRLVPPGIHARGYREATLVFADVVNLAELAAVTSPDRVVGILDTLLGSLDRVAARHGLSQVHVPGEAFAAVSGIPGARRDHLEAAANMALEASEAVARLFGQEVHSLALRIGLHSGPVVAALDAGGAVREVWGETTRIARAMEARSLPGKIQVSEAAARRLAVGYRLERANRGDALTRGVASRYLTGRRD